MDDRNTVFQWLLENPRFVAWAVGDAPDQDDYWQNWQQENPSRPEILEHARQTIKTIEGNPVNLPDDQVTAKIRQALAEARRQEKRLESFKTIHPFGRSWWNLAASIALLMGLSWSFYSLFNEKTATEKPAQPTTLPKEISALDRVVNNSSAPKHVLLPDGSSVVLRKNSQLHYAKVFTGDKREVYLSGEAFFEVSKNPQKPFFVIANGLITKVLGTSFSVKAYGSEGRVIVVVKTGKVSVFAQNDRQAETLRSNRELAGMVLMPNQQATFERNETRLVKTQVGTPVLLDMPIENQQFDYNATPVSKVFANLEKAYGVDIVFDEDIMARCSITATLGDEPLLKKMQWICTILEATYEVRGQQIFITGKAC
ncbi:FecR family protein [Larkinella rosea]|uniref:FecR family protein n=1 Tax=Larkinella rosea TaxID=2025312 RepID=A0A3P1C2A8_9BACT|nr:FecR family protein [Larkinella rosea]RRB07236.1 FecR family protein [Larkinella rosea]